MSSAQSRMKAFSDGFPRVVYGTTEHRLSRDTAAAGMLCVMVLNVIFFSALRVEKGLSVPAAQISVHSVQTQFRIVPKNVRQSRPEMKKLLTENSVFEIPAQKPPEVKPEPAPKPAPMPNAEEKKPKPEPKPEPHRKKVSRPKPAPKAEVRAQTVEKAAAAVGAVSGDGQVESPSSSGTASMSGATGGSGDRSDRRSEALAVIVQALEKYKQYPRQARRSGAEGVCQLLVHVGADGRVEACTLTEGSGRSVLDAAAARLGEKIVGLQVGTKGGFKVIVPVHYRLKDG